MQQTNGQDESMKRTYALGEAGVCFSVSAAIPMVVSLVLLLILPAAAGSDYAGQDWFKYLSYLLSPVGIAVACLLFFRRSKVPPRKVYGGCKWYYFLIALVLQFGVMFSLSELNGYFSRLLELMGYRISNGDDMLPSLGGWNLLPAILVIAVLPAIFEETLFRGVLVGRMGESGWGTASTVLISGALFSLFHTNPEQTLYQFVCGMGFALIALRAGSVLPSVVSHFANNAVILIVSSLGYAEFTDLPNAVYLSLVICSAVCLVGAVLFLLLFDRKKNVKGGVKEGKRFFLMAGVGIAVCAIQWIALLIERMI